MTIPDWDFEKYKVDFDDIHFSGPIIKAPLIMKTGWIIRYLHDVIFPDAVKAIVQGGELSGLLMGFSVVDYLAGYFAGKSSQEKDVKAFMYRYYPEQYKPYLNDIYSQIRNGLVHNLSIINPWIPHKFIFIIEKRSDLHLQIMKDKIVFSIFHFLEDGRRAMVMYLYDLVMKPDENRDLINNFERRFNKKDGAASMMAKTD